MTAAADSLRERLAAIEHDRWSDWQRYLHGKCSEVIVGAGVDPVALQIPAELVGRWERQIATPYAELSDTEKASDMEQVDRYWPLIVDAIQAARNEAAATTLQTANDARREFSTDPAITALRRLYEAVCVTTTIGQIRAAVDHPDNAAERELVDAICAAERALGLAPSPAGEGMG